VPQGVVPLAQLLIVPRPVVPSVEKGVLSRSEPRTGPLNAIGVFGVMRRLRLEFWTTPHARLAPSAASVTLTP
jgi:hypothetical protein